MRRIFLLLLTVATILPAYSQQARPKLVVGIVVDQMRQDYLLRFRKDFGQEGFDRFLSQGFEFQNAHYNYVPTNTAPGHTSVYTGTTPAVHGIISNSWFDQQLNETVYCAYDSTMNTIGADNENGKMSPHQLLVPTITDQLRLSTQMRSKVVGVSVKDRGAIFPAGHLGKAYWYDSKTGKMISSSYYHEKLPEWVQAFNNQNLADSYLTRTWSLLREKEVYEASGPDDSPYEMGLFGKTTFPYDLSESKNYGLVPATPFGNDLITEMAKAAVKGESMGKNGETDFLAVSYSSTDYIGHNFGPNSVEVQDTYLRLDRNLADLFAFLDKEVGAGEYVVFLTSDHGVAQVPKRLMDLNAGGGYMREDLTALVTEFLTEKYNAGNWVRSVSNMQVFLNRDLINEAGEDVSEVRKMVAMHLLKVNGIAATYTFEDMVRAGYGFADIQGALRRGFNQKRSGDVLYLLEPGWLQSGGDRGTSHGSPYDYDTHIPVLWYGKGIPTGKSSRHYSISDITPTMSMILQIELPSGTSGIPMEEVLNE